METNEKGSVSWDPWRLLIVKQQACRYFRRPSLWVMAEGLPVLLSELPSSAHGALHDTIPHYFPSYLLQQIIPENPNSWTKHTVSIYLIEEISKNSPECPSPSLRKDSTYGKSNPVGESVQRNLQSNKHTRKQYDLSRIQSSGISSGVQTLWVQASVLPLSQLCDLRADYLTSLSLCYHQ